MWGSQVIAVAGILGCLLAGCATVSIQETRVVTGRVTDEAGKPVASCPVVVVARSMELAAARFEYEERGRQEIKASTDAEGRYRIEFVPAQVGNNFFLFFYDVSGFDGVRYKRPVANEITDLLKNGGLVVVNQALEPSQTWPEVERQVAFYGAGSERGRILRTHGLPEKRERPPDAGADAEVWWYYEAGVSFWFTGDTLTKTNKFPPIRGASSSP
ncbi:MAG: carboxypeptidase-like regulatory domain-containing protein [candidate division NC10 bacterium]|nr:carboxypeptidase-like regulatory domain-containing protein [candidate division NC10 bacterium]